jgi:Tol biopolymer transport system component
VVTIADGQRRTLIENGGNPSWSPDGSQIAYLQCLELPDDVTVVHTVPADMADVDPMQPDASVWVAAADGTGARPIATSLAPPIWSPDGSLLIAVGDDGLFTVRPDDNGIGGGITRLTRGVTPRTMNVACTDDVGGPVWQPMPPSADTGA